MKNIIVISVFIVTGAFAQTNKEIKATGMYCCTKAKCEQCSAKAGVCPHHNTALVMEGKYYCPMHPEVTSDAEGKCNKCGMALIKMEMQSVEKYCCTDCGLTQPVKGQCPHSTQAIIKDGELKCALCFDKAGKCPKCGTEMRKVEVKKKKE